MPFQPPNQQRQSTEGNQKKIRQKSVKQNLDICAISCHELFVNERTSLSDVTDSTVDAAPAANLHHTTTTELISHVSHT